MRQITTDQMTGLLTDHEPPCISLYQPTHRNHPENQQDPIRYRNLLAEMETSLRQKYPTRDVRTLLEQFQALARDVNFWNHRTDGMAILSSSDTFQVFDLQLTVPELLVVADSFHTKPLLRVLQSADRYQVLALSRHEAKLYEGNRYALDPIKLTNVPSTLTEALGAELTESHLTVASYGAGASRSAGGGVTPSIHGQGGRKDEVEIDRDRFFRTIDKGILDYHSRPSGLPLMLATLPENHEPFHAISHNPSLMADGIMKNPESLSLDQLRAEAWRIVEPVYLQRLAKLSDDFQVARSRDLGSDNLAQIAEAATAGRVGTLLVEADRQFPGTIDRVTGQFRSGALSDPEVDDVLDDLAELVLRMKGEVVVVPMEHMPSKTGVAASYRFQLS
jgi:Bacterial archaeo-eukaryotic release factor family 3